MLELVLGDLVLIVVEVVQVAGERRSESAARIAIEAERSNLCDQVLDGVGVVEVGVGHAQVELSGDEVEGAGVPPRSGDRVAKRRHQADVVSTRDEVDRMRLEPCRQWDALRRPGSDTKVWFVV